MNQQALSAQRAPNGASYATYPGKHHLWPVYSLSTAFCRLLLFRM